MQRIDQIVLQLKRFLTKTGHQESEKADVEALVKKHPSLKALLEQLKDEDKFMQIVREYDELRLDDQTMAQDPVLERILSQIRQTPDTPKFTTKRYWLGYWMAGAAACVALVLGVLWLKPWEEFQPVDTMEIAARILPNENGATLSMSDGRIIQLRSEEGGIISGDQLQYSDGSPLLEDGTEVSDAVMTLSVPRGNDFYVVLDDGTKVWLNAESELRYPQTFTGTKRVVQLVGEAYFEVAKDKNKPFIVETPAERIEVLGTHFNVNSYPKESKSMVTLVEGKVEVSIGRQRGQVLIPGQQAVVQRQQLRVREVNIDEYIAWKNKEFMFNDESLVHAVSRIGRWYDLKIEVDPSLKDIYLWGSVPRSENFGQVLKLIQLTNKDVKVKIEGRRVRFMK